MNFILLTFWIGTIVGIAGTFLNARQRRESFILWGFSNIVIICQTYITESWNLLFSALVYLGLAVYGWHFWKDNSRNIVDVRKLPDHLQSAIYDWQQSQS